MFERQALSDAPKDSGSSRRRRGARGLGPFSGGQLTIIIVTVVVAVAFPMAAGAVGTAMNLVDATSGAQARVDAGHNLHAAVADPAGVNIAKVDAKSNLNTAIHDAVSGTAAKVNGLGQMSAAVTGSVTANATKTAFGSGQINPPGDSSYAPIVLIGSHDVMTIQVDTYSVSGGGGAIQFTDDPYATDCSSPSNVFRTFSSVDPATKGVTELTFGPGGYDLSGVTLCVRNTGPANLGAAVFVFYR